MSDNDIMTVLQCCSYDHRKDRMCYACPLHDDRNCHATLCNIVIEHLVNEHCIRERIANDLSRMQKSLSL